MQILLLFIDTQKFLNIAIHFDRNLRAQVFCLHRQNDKWFLFTKDMFAGAPWQELINFSEYLPCWISGALSFFPYSSHALWKRGLRYLFLISLRLQGWVSDESPVQVWQKVKLTQLKIRKHTTKSVVRM